MSYEHFVTNYRRQTHFARSLDEAYRTPEYCCAITVYKSESKEAWEQAKNLIAHIIFIIVVVIFALWFLTA